MLKRYLAGCIIDRDGQRYPLSILTVSDNGSYSISPFEHETASTVYISGTLVVGDSLPQGFRRVRQHCRIPMIWECETSNRKKS